MKLKQEFEPKKESLLESVARDIKERYGEKVKTVWRVEEYTDGWDQDDNYVPARARTHSFSPWYDSKEEAEAVMEKSEPSSNLYGARLKVVHRSLFRKWVPAHWKETWL